MEERVSSILGKPSTNCGTSTALCLFCHSPGVCVWGGEFQLTLTREATKDSEREMIWQSQKPQQQQSQKQNPDFLSSKTGSFPQHEDVSGGHDRIMPKDNFPANKAVQVWQQTIREHAYQWQNRGSDLEIFEAVLRNRLSRAGEMAQ